MWSTSLPEFARRRQWQEVASLLEMGVRAGAMDSVEAMQPANDARPDTAAAASGPSSTPQSDCSSSHSATAATPPPPRRRPRRDTTAAMMQATLQLVTHVLVDHEAAESAATEQQPDSNATSANSNSGVLTPERLLSMVAGVIPLMLQSMPHTCACIPALRAVSPSSSVLPVSPVSPAAASAASSSAAPASKTRPPPHPHCWRAQLRWAPIPSLDAIGIQPIRPVAAATASPAAAAAAAFADPCCSSASATLSPADALALLHDCALQMHLLLLFLTPLADLLVRGAQTSLDHAVPVRRSCFSLASYSYGAALMISKAVASSLAFVHSLPSQAFESPVALHQLQSLSTAFPAFRSVLLTRYDRIELLFSLSCLSPSLAQVLQAELARLADVIGSASSSHSDSPDSAQQIPLLLSAEGTLASLGALFTGDLLRWFLHSLLRFLPSPDRRMWIHTHPEIIDALSALLGIFRMQLQRHCGDLLKLSAAEDGAAAGAGTNACTATEEAFGWALEQVISLVFVLAPLGHLYDQHLLDCLQVLSGLPLAPRDAAALAKHLANLYARKLSVTASAAEAEAIDHMSVTGWKDGNLLDLMHDPSAVLHVQERTTLPSGGSSVPAASTQLNAEDVPAMLYAPFETAPGALSVLDSASSSAPSSPSSPAAASSSSTTSSGVAYSAAFRRYEFSWNTQQKLNAHRAAGAGAGAGRASVVVGASAASSRRTTPATPGDFTIPMHLLAAAAAPARSPLASPPAAAAASWMPRGSGPGSQQHPSDGASSAFALVHSLHHYTRSVFQLLRELFSDAFAALGGGSDQTAATAGGLPLPGFQVLALGAMARGEGSSGGSSDFNLCVLLADDQRHAQEIETLSSPGNTFAPPPPIAARSLFFRALFALVDFKLRALRNLGYPLPQLDAAFLASFAYDAPAVSPLAANSVRGLALEVVDALKHASIRPVPKQALAILLCQQHLWSWSAPGQHTPSEQMVGELNQRIWSQYLLVERMHDGERFASVYSSPAATSAATMALAAAAPTAGSSSSPPSSPGLLSASGSWVAVAPGSAAAAVTPSSPQQPHSDTWYADLHEELTDLHATQADGQQAAASLQEEDEGSAAHHDSAATDHLDPSVHNLSTHRFAATATQARSTAALLPSPHQLLLAASHAHDGQLHPLVRIRLERLSLFLLKQCFSPRSSTATNPLLSLPAEFAAAQSQLLTGCSLDSLSDVDCLLSSHFLRPLTLWVSLCGLFCGVDHPSVFATLRALREKGRIHVRFEKQMHEAIRWAMQQRNQGSCAGTIESDSAASAQPAVATGSAKPVNDRCNCDELCSQPVSAGRLSSNSASSSLPWSLSLLPSSCACPCSCSTHLFPCCRRGSSSTLQSLHGLTWDLLMPLHEATTLMTQESKSWGLPTQLVPMGMSASGSAASTGSSSNSSSRKASAEPMLSSFSACMDSDVLRSNYDPLLKCLGDWVASRSAFQHAQSQAIGLQLSQHESIDALPFQTQIDTLQQRITVLLHKLAHDMTVPGVTLPASDGSSSEGAVSRMMASQKVYFHALAQHAATRFLYAHIFQSHALHNYLHAEPSPATGGAVAASSRSAASEPSHAWLRRLLKFFASWPVHSGGRAGSVAAEMQARDALQSMLAPRISVSAAASSSSSSSSSVPAASAAQIVWQPNWSNLNEVISSRCGGSVSPVISAQIAESLRKHPEPCVFTSSAVASRPIVWLLPGPAAGESPTPQTQGMQRVLFQQLAANMLSDLVSGLCTRSFLAELTLSRRRASDAPAPVALQSKASDPAILMVPTPGAILLADLVADESMGAAAEGDLERHNLALLERSLDARCFTLKFIESLLMCPREEGVHELCAVPVAANAAVSGLDPFSDAAGHGFPSGPWQRHTRYALVRTPISFPFKAEAYECLSTECAERREQGAPACSCIQQSFVYRDVIEHRRSRTSLQERLHVRSLLFCMDRVQEPLDLQALSEVLNLDLKQVLQHWLTNLVRLSGGMQAPQQPKGGDSADASAPEAMQPCTLPPLTIQHLVARWEHIQSVLRVARDEGQTGSHGRRMLHWELLERVDQPLFECVNTYAWNQRIRENDRRDVKGSSPESTVAFTGQALRRFRLLPRTWQPVKLGYLHQCDKPSHFVTRMPFYALLPSVAQAERGQEEPAAMASYASSASESLQELLETTLPAMASHYSNLRALVYRLRMRQSLFYPSKLSPALYEMLLNLTDWDRSSKGSGAASSAGDESAQTHHIRVSMPSRKATVRAAAGASRSRRGSASSVGDPLPPMLLADESFESSLKDEGASGGSVPPSPAPASGSSTPLAFTPPPSGVLGSTAARYAMSADSLSLAMLPNSAIPQHHSLPSSRASVAIARRHSVSAPALPPPLLPNSLWTKASLSELLRSIPLSHVHVPCCHLLTDVLQDLAVTSGSSLHSLDLSECPGLVTSGPSLTALANKCRNLSWLNLSGLGGLVELSSGVSQGFFRSSTTTAPLEFPQLRTLYVNQCLSLRSIRIVAPKLVELYARDCVHLAKISLGPENKLTSVSPYATGHGRVPAAELHKDPPHTVLLKVDLRGCHSLQPDPLGIMHADYLQANPTLEKLQHAAKAAAEKAAALASKSSSTASSSSLAADHPIPFPRYSTFDGASSAAQWGGWWLRELDLSAWNPDLFFAPRPPSPPAYSHGHHHHGNGSNLEAPRSATMIVGPLSRVLQLRLNHAPGLTALTIDSACLESLSLRDCTKLKSLTIKNSLSSSLKEMDLTSVSGLVDSLATIHALVRSLPLLSKLMLNDPSDPSCAPRKLVAEWATFEREHELRNGATPSPVSPGASAVDVAGPALEAFSRTLAELGPHLTFFSFSSSPLRRICKELQSGSLAVLTLTHHHECSLSPLHPRATAGYLRSSGQQGRTNDPDTSPAYTSTRSLGQVLKKPQVLGMSHAVLEATMQQASAQANTPPHSNLSIALPGVSSWSRGSSDAGASSPALHAARSFNDASGMSLQPSSPFASPEPGAAEAHNDHHGPVHDEFCVWEKDDSSMLALAAALRSFGWMNSLLNTMDLGCVQEPVFDPLAHAAVASSSSSSSAAAATPASSLTAEVGLPALVSAVLSVPFLAHLSLRGHHLGHKLTTSLLGALAPPSSSAHALATGKMKEWTPQRVRSSSYRASQAAAAIEARRRARENGPLSTVAGDQVRFSFVSQPGALHFPQLESLTLSRQSLPASFVALGGPLHLFLEHAHPSLTSLNLSSNLLGSEGLRALGALIKVLGRTKEVPQKGAFASPIPAGLGWLDALLELNVEDNGFTIDDALEFAKDVDAAQPHAGAEHDEAAGDDAAASSSSASHKKKKASKSDSSSESLGNGAAGSKSYVSRLTLGCTPLIAVLLERLLPMHVECWTEALNHSKARATHVVSTRESELKAASSPAPKHRDGSSASSSLSPAPLRPKEQLKLEKALALKQHEELAKWEAMLSPFIHYGVQASTTPASAAAAAGSSPSARGSSPVVSSALAADGSFGYGSASGFGAGSALDSESSLLLDSFPVPRSIVSLDSASGVVSSASSSGASFARGVLQRMSEAAYLRFMHNQQNRAEEEARTPSVIVAPPNRLEIRGESGEEMPASALSSSRPLRDAAALISPHSENHFADGGGALQIDYSSSGGGHGGGGGDSFFPSPDPLSASVSPASRSQHSSGRLAQSNLSPQHQLPTAAASGALHQTPLQIEELQEQDELLAQWHS